jgi:cell division septation protein DedD
MSEELARGVHLSDKQIVFGVMTATVVAVVVFLCGVFVGRGVHALRPPLSESAAFDNRVVPDASPLGAETEAGAAFGVDAAGTITAPPEKLTYPDRLGKGTPPAESLPATEPGPPVPPPDAPEGAGDGAASAGTGLRPARVTAAAPKSPQASTTPSTAAVTAGSAGTGSYTVQVSAVRRRTEAQAIVDRLKKKGFPAFVFTPPPGDPRGGFRVRVGSFGSRQEAAPTAARLQKEGYQPWITR